MDEEIIGEDITPEDSIVPVYLVPLTVEEEAERIRTSIEESNRLAELQAQEDAKKSAREKLSRFGLTEDEIKAVIGF